MRARRNQTTQKSRVVSEFMVVVINPAGKPESSVSCHSVAQCREVVRVEAPVHGPYTLFFVTQRGLPVERWAVGRSGTIQKLSYR